MPLTDEKFILEVYEGHDVVETAVEFPSLGGGFHESQKIDPRILHHGDTGYIVLAYETKKVRFDPVDKDEPLGDLRRVHVLTATAATYSDDPKVARIIDQHRKIVQKRKDEEAGQGTFDPDADD